MFNCVMYLRKYCRSVFGNYICRKYKIITLFLAGDKLLHGTFKGAWKARKLPISLCIQYILLSKTVIWRTRCIKEVDKKGNVNVVVIFY